MVTPSLTRFLPPHSFSYSPTPHSPILTPPPLTPPSSLPHSSLLTPPPSLSHPSLLHPSPRTPHPSPLTPTHHSPTPPHSSLTLTNFDRVPAWYLHHHIIQTWLKASCCCLGNRVLEGGKGEGESQLGCNVGKGVAGRLGGKGGAS